MYSQNQMGCYWISQAEVLVADYAEKTELYPNTQLDFQSKDEIRFIDIQLVYKFILFNTQKHLIQMISPQEKSKRSPGKYSNSFLQVQSELIDSFYSCRIPKFYQNLFINHIKKMPSQEAELTMKEEIKSLLGKQTYIQSFLKSKSEKLKLEQYLKEVFSQQSQRNVDICNLCESIKRLRNLNYKATHYLSKIRQKYEFLVRIDSSLEKQFFSDFATHIDSFRRQFLNTQLSSYIDWEPVFDPFFMYGQQKRESSSSQINESLRDLFSFPMEESFKLLKAKKILMGWMYLNQNKELVNPKKSHFPEIKHQKYFTYENIKEQLSIESQQKEKEQMNKTKFNRNGGFFHHQRQKYQKSRNRYKNNQEFEPRPFIGKIKHSQVSRNSSYFELKEYQRNIVERQRQQKNMLNYQRSFSVNSPVIEEKRYRYQTLPHESNVYEIEPQQRLQKVLNSQKKRREFLQKKLESRNLINIDIIPIISRIKEKSIRQSREKQSSEEYDKRQKQSIYHRLDSPVVNLYEYPYDSGNTSKNISKRNSVEQSRVDIKNVEQSSMFTIKGENVQPPKKSVSMADRYEVLSNFNLKKSEKKQISEFKVQDELKISEKGEDLQRGDTDQNSQALTSFQEKSKETVGENRKSKIIESEMKLNSQKQIPQITENKEKNAVNNPQKETSLSTSLKQEKKEVKIKIGKFTLQTFKTKFISCDFIPDYFKEYDSAKVIKETELQQTYVFEFLINNIPSVFALHSITQNNNLVIRFWALCKNCDPLLASALFKKYSDFLEKQVSNEQLYYRGSYFVQVKEAGFIPFKQGIFIRKRTTKAKQTDTQFEPYINFSCSSISFRQDQKEDLLVSAEIEKFTSSNAKGADFLFSANSQKIPEKLQETITTKKQIPNLSELNNYLSNIGFDSYQTSSNIKTSKINSVTLDFSSDLKCLFVACDGFFKFYGTLVFKTETKTICSIKTTLNNGRICFSRGYSTIEEVERDIKADSQNKIQFIVPMFNKKLYGRYNPKAKSEESSYCNWDISLFWEDQCQGLIKHSFQGFLKFGETPFYATLELQQQKLMTFSVTENDFIY